MEPKPPSVAPWELIGREPVFAARPWVEVSRDVVRLPTGRVIPDFYRVVLPDFVVCVVRTVEGLYPVVKGYKHGLGGVTLSPPAGQIDPGEDPLAAAQRELLEETGYEAHDWQLLGRYVVDGNRQCGTMYLFTATNARRVATPKVDELEPLEVVCLTRAQATAALFGGECQTLPGASGLALAFLQVEPGS